MPLSHCPGRGGRRLRMKRPALVYGREQLGDLGGSGQRKAPLQVVDEPQSAQRMRQVVLNGRYCGAIHSDRLAGIRVLCGHRVTFLRTFVLIVAQIVRRVKPLQYG